MISNINIIIVAAETITTGDVITIDSRPVVVSDPARPYRGHGRDLVRVDGRGMWDNIITDIDFDLAQPVEILRITDTD
jgi:hypothetical protein